MIYYIIIIRYNTFIKINYLVNKNISNQFNNINFYNIKCKIMYAKYTVKFIEYSLSKLNNKIII